MPDQLAGGIRSVASLAENPHRTKPFVGSCNSYMYICGTVYRHCNHRYRDGIHMTILDILHFPDPRLRNIAQPVEQVDDAIRKLVDEMFETMYAAPGIGLAATQVNVDKRVIVIDVSEEKDQPLCLINPEILARDGVEVMEEGCLSVPGVFELVERADHVRIQALNQDGERFEMEAGDLLAVCIQHEIDHLDGKLFVDYLSPLKRARIRKKLEKEQRQSPAGTESHPGTRAI
jgi:peptide deformylase